MTAIITSTAATSPPGVAERAVSDHAQAAGSARRPGQRRGRSSWRVDSVGEGTPAVILLNRMNPADDEWAELRTRLESLTRVVTYDRPGLAGGDPLSAPVAKGLRTVAAATSEFETLLWETGLKPPYVLVASSIGCWIADQYAIRAPREVAGAVLIDPVGLMPWPISAHRPPNSGDDGDTGYLPRIDTESFVELAITVPTEPRRTVVISSSDGRWQRDPPASVTAWRPDTLTEMDQVWQGYQRDWVRRTNARHVIADTAGHLVHRDQPDLVTAVVTAVVGAARARKQLDLDPTVIASNGGCYEPRKRKSQSRQAPPGEPGPGTV